GALPCAGLPLPLRGGISVACGVCLSQIIYAAPLGLNIIYLPDFLSFVEATDMSPRRGSGIGRRAGQANYVSCICECLNLQM
ncbi:MAG: hypothetical protein ACK505_00530, partial [Flavobacteriales bacterium]